MNKLEDGGVEEFSLVEDCVGILAWEVLEVVDFSIGERLHDVEEESDLAILVGREKFVSVPGRGPRFFFML